MPDASPPPALHVRFLVEGLRTVTRGLRALDHPELAVEVTDPAKLPAARALLLSLATDVVLRRRSFMPGERVPYGGELLRLATSTLEVWEHDPESGRLVHGAPRLLASLEGSL